jgi:hypothetical protein
VADETDAARKATSHEDARRNKRAMKKICVVLAGLVVLPVVVAAGAVEWAWREAKVDTRGGHVVLLHGSGNADPRSWVPAARVGRPRGHVFPVEWLVDVNAAENMELVEAVTLDLDFYLKDVGRPDPWSYARYHCQTTSNWYGDVHWACP